MNVSNLNTWQLQDAKNKFSELIKKTLTEGPQYVTKHGELVVTIVPADKYQIIPKPKQKN